MATVLSTNLNLFTDADVDPRRHRVISWAWRDASRAEAEQRAEMERETRHALRRFAEAEELARAYHAPKAMVDTLPGALRWVVGAVRGADRVLLSAPLAGRDRALWLAAYAGARLLRRPIHLYSEDWLEPQGTARASTWLRRRLRRDAARILVPAETHRAFQLAAGVPPARVRRIDSIYCPRPEPRALLPVRRSPVTLLYVGRAIPCKGLARLAELVAPLVGAGRARLVVVLGGDAQYAGSDPGYPARCRRLLAQLPTEAVEVLEHVDDVDPLYARADVLVMPNTIVRDRVPAEAWGRVVEEALHAGVPVVSTDAVPAARELVAEGVNGHVVPWDDDAALAQALAAVAAGRADGRST